MGVACCCCGVGAAVDFGVAVAVGVAVGVGCLVTVGAGCLVTVGLASIDALAATVGLGLVAGVLTPSHPAMETTNRTTTKTPKSVVISCLLFVMFTFSS